ncbi:MAG: deoxyribodipyrimidine photo-lyase [Alphaproteobacteria bacterium]|nr:deoxyribodipyrimidine photo-lyase [Alphaproteobacteria bacterium]
MTSTRPAIVWFRQDLRLADNPALTAASHSGRPLVCAFVLDDSPGNRTSGGASRWWLLHSLIALAADLGDLGMALVLRKGRAVDEITRLIEETNAAEIHYCDRIEPGERELGRAVETLGSKRDIAIHRHNGLLLHPPGTIATKGGDPYKVFTPFFRACRDRGDPAAPLPRPDRLTAFGRDLRSSSIDSLGLISGFPWWTKLEAYWEPGERGAQERLRDFLDGPIDDYGTNRDFPARAGTSRLSPHLHFGEISPRQIWHAAGDRSETFLREIGWREFCHHLLAAFPDLPERPMQAQFSAFPWNPDSGALHVWKKGRTGYPIVDAGMRELWATGWMHNRVRMIVGSFLVKHLRLPWQEGERWFWDTLVDADLANNAGGWQWIAGCGADAAPYFRIFNPMTQGEKFDPGGDYVRRYVPELARLPDKFIHAPWTAPPGVLSNAGVTLGETYPNPIVDHREARAAALKAFEEMRGRG